MATTTITTTAGEDARIVAAVGFRIGAKDANGDPRNATGAEVKAFIGTYLRTIVTDYEQSHASIPAPINPT